MQSWRDKVEAVLPCRAVTGGGAIALQPTTLSSRARIVCTIIEPTDLVILDDGLARQVAAAQGLRYTGTLGILIQAKRAGLVPAVMPLVAQLQQAGFRLTASLVETIRQIVGE